jgi:hypothetical protein
MDNAKIVNFPSVVYVCTNAIQFTAYFSNIETLSNLETFSNLERFSNFGRFSKFGRFATENVRLSIRQVTKNARCIPYL